MTTHRAAAGLIAAGIGLNLIGAALGKRTICTAGRERLHIDHPAGLALSGVGFAVLEVLSLAHFYDKRKRPVR